MTILYRDICRILSYFFFGLTAALCIPFSVAAYFQFIASAESHPQPHSTLAFLGSIAVCFCLAGIFYYIGKKSTGFFFRREGILVVVLVWFLTPGIAALPYLFSGTLHSPFQAYFEAVSGLSTTGATTMTAKNYDDKTGEEIPNTRIIRGVHDVVYEFYGTIEPVRDPKTYKIMYSGIEAVSQAVLFWRSFTQWLGGMGVIVLFVAVLPALGIGGKQLFHAEMPGPMNDSLTPRIKETASHLWKIYLGITFLEVISLSVFGKEMSFFEVLTVTFSTVSTGGFTVTNTSLGAFSNPAIHWIVMIFMVVGSINFSLYYYALCGKLFRLYDRELIIYVIVLLSACFFTSYFIMGTEKLSLTSDVATTYSMSEAFLCGFFQIISAMTTTGFATVDYDIWPYTAQVIMVMVMYFGAMAGSTSGGMKIMRVYILFRIAQYKVESLFRPKNVRNFRIGESSVDTSSSLRVLCFFLILVATATVATFFYMMDGMDPESAFTLTTTLINNVGIGFRIAGPTESCAFLTSPALCLSCFLMILGRLEFLAVLAVLVPAFWKQHS